MNLLVTAVSILVVVLIIDKLLTHKEQFSQVKNRLVKQCLKNTGHGICIKNDQLNCVLGDINGPYFTEDCKYWKIVDDYNKTLFNNSIVTTTKPVTTFYPEYEQRFINNSGRVML